MSIARNYLAKEIYRSTLVVMLALMGLFSFFTLVEQLDAVSEVFPLTALLYVEALALPARLYELLPIGVLIGAILALAGLAHRNELAILRVSGLGAMGLLGMLWVISIPLIALAILVSEVITPAAEIRYSEANLVLRGKVQGGRLVSGYWFKEPMQNSGSRVINIGRLLSTGEVADLSIYEFDDGINLSRRVQAKRGLFEEGQMTLLDITRTVIPVDAMSALAKGIAPDAPIVQIESVEKSQLDTSLTPARLVARIATPERMSLSVLWDYIGYLKSNQIDASRQVVAVWRKLAYPFTLIVMLTIAAPVSYMQSRRGGVGAKIFIGILVGTVFFMISQLMLNVGLLYGWHPVVTALLPSVVVFILAIAIMLRMQRQTAPKKQVFSSANERTTAA
jgi:lipopolysaccharide export system permease protein